MSHVGLVAKIRQLERDSLAYASKCQQNLLDMLSSEDEDDISSSDEEDEHSAWDFFREVVGQSSGMLVVSFIEDEELARTALSRSSLNGSPVPGDVRCPVV